jgi:mannose-6-phosphate isomerase-like protein (cupin superfamily)
MSQYGAYYYRHGEELVHDSRSNDLYFYQAFIGSHKLNPDSVKGSYIYLSDDKKEALWSVADKEVDSKHFAVYIAGYQCGDKSTSLGELTNLPYVNGCSTRQIFSPERLGDPTLQQLTIPPYTAEQMHHIHPTARVVYVLKGKGWSIVGQADSCTETELTEGMVCVLDPMCPHHFRTEGDSLTVLPVHVWSSLPSNMEQNHPMFNGTKEV